jgi:5-methylcytosine-specific restriction endonuclease McrA
MISRQNEYETFLKHKRKIFSEPQKRQIAFHQEYKCVGEICRSMKLLPPQWELDHFNPLFKGGSNYYNFENKNDQENNLCVICPGCHAIKTQREKIEFYQDERKHKYDNSTFIIAKDFYKQDIKEKIDDTKLTTFCFDDFKYKKSKN